MLVIRAIDPSFALGLFHDPSSVGRLTPAQVREYCFRRGLLSLVAEEDGDLIGCLVAESGPRAVTFVVIDGDTPTCELLLDRLIRRAGERDACGWCPVDRDDIRRLLEERGFTPEYEGRVLGLPAVFYYCNQNGPAGAAG